MTTDDDGPPVAATLVSLAPAQEEACGNLAARLVDIDPTRGTVSLMGRDEETVLVWTFEVAGQAAVIGGELREHMRQLLRQASAMQEVRGRGAGGGGVGGGGA